MQLIYGEDALTDLKRHCALTSVLDKNNAANMFAE
jgi:hypothetical protein